MGVPKRLTEMQRKFAELLVFGDNGKALTKTEAAKLAGFSPNRCRQEGYELTNPKIHPLVVDYIGKLREEKLQKYMVTFEGHIAELDRIKELALKKGSFSSAVNAESAAPSAALTFVPVSGASTVTLATPLTFRTLSPAEISAAAVSSMS